jgi:carboxylate-amine ligase
LSSDTIDDLPPSGEALRRAFDDAGEYTIGVEDEVMLLDPDGHELAPTAPEVLALLPDDGSFKLELPASQLEIMSGPADTVLEVCHVAWTGRKELVRRAHGLVKLAAAGTHPFSPGIGELNGLTRHQDTVSAYTPLVQRQLVCAFQVHVAPGEADRALSVYNAARSYLPLLAALSANAPFYEGQDSGLASVRPKLCELLPRQGVPPPLASWDELAGFLRWGSTARLFRPGAWWWELRPHWRFGTLEFRVPDGQSSLADAAAVAAVVHALVVWLGRRHDAGERLETAPAWMIAENRWSACRDGVESRMADLRTGASRTTRSCLYELLDELEAVSLDLGSRSLLSHARQLVECNGAMRQRGIAASGGMTGLSEWLCERFLEPLSG